MSDLTSLFQQPGTDAATRQLKVLVTGPFSAGKTTLIKTISEIAVVATDRNVTDASSAVKKNTTVAMDFGRITFADNLTLYVFGTPGQARFEVMWEILSEGMLGFIVLVHAADARSVHDAAHILSKFRAYSDVPYIVGVTHLDEVMSPRDQVLSWVRRDLGLPESVSVLACDPRDREDVTKLMLQMLKQVLERLKHPAE